MSALCVMGVCMNICLSTISIVSQYEYMLSDYLGAMHAFVYLISIRMSFKLLYSALLYPFPFYPIYPIYSILPYPTLPYPTLPYPTIPYPTLPYPTLLLALLYCTRRHSPLRSCHTRITHLHSYLTHVYSHHSYHSGRKAKRKSNNGTPLEDFQQTPFPVPGGSSDSVSTADSTCVELGSTERLIRVTYGEGDTHQQQRQRGSISADVDGQSNVSGGGGDGADDSITGQGDGGASGGVEGGNLLLAEITCWLVGGPPPGLGNDSIGANSSSSGAASSGARGSGAVKLSIGEEVVGASSGTLIIVAKCSGAIGVPSSHCAHHPVLA